LRTEKDSLKMELFEGNQYKDEVSILKKEKERLSDKVDALWKELKDHQDMNHATEKEHLDLRRELESQIRDKDEDIKALKIQINGLQKNSSGPETSSNDSVTEETPLPVSVKSPKTSKESKVPRKKLPTSTKKSIEEKHR